MTRPHMSDGLGDGTCDGICDGTCEVAADGMDEGINVIGHNVDAAQRGSQQPGEWITSEWPIEELRRALPQSYATPRRSTAPGTANPSDGMHSAGAASCRPHALLLGPL